ncbi:MAG: hypothetical protein HY298_15265 [Verrucomicrobia bacterium]|nr:hypothetical protein [Verrucomicrobiota bacterium]
MKKGHIGSNFDDFLAQEGLLAECEAGALKRVVTWQLAQSFHQRKRADPRVKPSGSKLGIDATKKIPGEGFKRPWPPLIKMDAAVKAKV